MTSTRDTIALLAGREITTRWQSKGFRAALLVTVVIVAIIAFLPKVFGDRTESYDIGLSGSSSAAVSARLEALATQRDVKVTVHPTDSAHARQMVRDGKWDAALLDDERIVAGSADSTATALLQAGVADVRVDERLTQAGVDVAAARAALAVPPLPVDTVHGDSGKRSAIALITIIALFSQLITYISWVAMGVVEEKSSRVIELLLSAVRPWQLLTGKLVGIGVLAFAQIAAMAVVGLGVAIGTHSVTLPPGAVGVVATAVGWFVLAFGFYAALSAALGSLVARQEEVSGVLAPISAVLMASYGLGFAAVYAPHSAVARIASIVPPFSAIGMPARLASGGVAVIDVVIAVVLMLAATVGVVAIGAKIYRAAVLHTGSKLGLRAAWRGEAVADVR